MIHGIQHLWSVEGQDSNSIDFLNQGIFVRHNLPKSVSSY